MRQKRFYIAGPMSGLPLFNHPAFYCEASKIESEGHIVLSPAILPVGLEHEEYMRICMPMLEVSDEVVLLMGWQNSRGARAEHEYAACLGKVIHYPDGLISYPETLGVQL